MYRESYGFKDWITTDLCLLRRMKVDVEKHKWNRPFFKTLGKLSKFTLWWALFETGNTPDPLPTADSLRRASSVGFGGGQATLVNTGRRRLAPTTVNIVDHRRPPGGRHTRTAPDRRIICTQAT